MCTGAGGGRWGDRHRSESRPGTAAYRPCSYLMGITSRTSIQSYSKHVDTTRHATPQTESHRHLMAYQLQGDALVLPFLAFDRVLRFIYRLIDPCLPPAPPVTSTVHHRRPAGRACTDGHPQRDRGWRPVMPSRDTPRRRRHGGGEREPVWAAGKARRLPTKWLLARLLLLLLRTHASRWDEYA